MTILKETILKALSRFATKVAYLFEQILYFKKQEFHVPVRVASFEKKRNSRL